MGVRLLEVYALKCFTQQAFRSESETRQIQQETLLRESPLKLQATYSTVQARYYRRDNKETRPVRATEDARQ